MADTAEEVPAPESFFDTSTKLPKSHVTEHAPHIFSAALAGLGFVVSFVVALQFQPLLSALIIAVVIAALLLSSVHICMEWERVVVVRMGRFARVADPGIYFTFPLIEFAAGRIDERIITVSFGAEEALTADLVPVDVDAVMYWGVWDARKACVEIRNYATAVALSGQTALRDAIGRVDLADLAMRRQELDHELQAIVGEKTNDWGVSIISVEIRNISIPQELQDAMSKEAQAVRERNARITLAEVEKDISEMFVEAADVYANNDKALQLRAMNLVYESVKDNGGLVVAPSSIADVFGKGL